MNRRRLTALIAAPLALALSATPALAGVPDSQVTIVDSQGNPLEEPVCEFHFWFAPVEGGETGSWELYAEDDTLVANGEYAVTTTEGDIEPNGDPLRLDDGTYTLAWDDEAPVDLSREELTVTVDCEEATATPEPTGTVAPATGTPGPTGTVEPATGTPGPTDRPQVTPPATDIATSETGQPGIGLPVALLALGLVAALALLAPVRRGRQS